MPRNVAIVLGQTTSISTEPIFQSGVDTSFMYDNFESYTSVASMLSSGGGPYTSWFDTGHLVFITNDGQDGQKCVEHNYDDANDPILERNFDIGTPASDHIICSFYYKNSSGHFHGKIWATMFPSGQHRYMLENTTSGGDYLNDAANGLLCWWNADGSAKTSNTPDFQREGVGWYHDDPSGPNGVGALFKQNINYQLLDPTTVFTDGNWHRITTKFGRGTNVAFFQDIECWIDGIKVMEFLGSNPSRCEYGKVYGRTWANSDNTFTTQLGGPRSIPEPDPGRNRRDNVRIWRKN